MPIYRLLSAASPHSFTAFQVKMNLTFMRHCNAVGQFHGNGRTFRDSFSTFKHIYHKDLVCENKSNVIIVWLYTIPFIFKQNFLTSLFCLQNMHINEAGNGRTVKWTWVFHPVHIFCKLCEFCEVSSFYRYAIHCLVFQLYYVTFRFKICHLVGLKQCQM